MYKIEVTECEDREGVEVFIIDTINDDMVSLICAENEGEFSNGRKVPQGVINRARKIADRVGY